MLCSHIRVQLKCLERNIKGSEWNFNKQTKIKGQIGKKFDDMSDSMSKDKF